jgi:prepilin peptidase CpaA
MGAVTAGLVCGAWSGGPAGLATAAAGAAVGFVVFLLLHWLGGMGGGDVKLMAGFGALLGPAGILGAALAASVVGALMAATILLWRPRQAAIPYAPAIVAGVWLVLLGRT